MNGICLSIQNNMSKLLSVTLFIISFMYKYTSYMAGREALGFPGVIISFRHDLVQDKTWNGEPWPKENILHHF